MVPMFPASVPAAMVTPASSSLLQIRQRDIVRLLDPIERGIRISQGVLDSLRQFVLRNLCHIE